MKAKEMFEELGYKVDELDFEDYNVSIRYIKKVNSYPNDWFITFRKNKTWFSYGGIDYIDEITIDKFKAIQKQMKELGWLDEK